jgi:hypothetical protein
MTNEWWEALALGGMGGLLLGLIAGSQMAHSYWRSKGPDSVGFRTAMYSGGKFYYVVTEHEYVHKVMRDG